MAQKRGEEIRRYILQNIESYPSSITSMVATHYGLTRQGAYRYVKQLVAEGKLESTGRTSNRTYKLIPLVEWSQHFHVEPGLAEDRVWTEHIEPNMRGFPENVVDIWHYCFTEMFNNALDHSEAKIISFNLSKDAANTTITILDDGIGIFRKIQNAMQLVDERHAVLELSKGKLTTSPEKHTGQGIFFTSRMADQFDILSGGVYFAHMLGGEDLDWITERPVAAQGTAILMKLSNYTTKTTKKIFDQYSDKEDFGFVKTVVPVRLAQHGNDKLISRSQAKRVMARVDLFKIVVLNFEGVPTIGQAFADEVFRVFAQEHPGIEIHPFHANSEVRKIIESAKAEKPSELPTNLSLL